MAVVANGIIILWSGTNATIPSGWTRETALDGRYPKGAPAATNPGGTGGALTHSHTTTTHVHTAAHTHTVPNTTGTAGSSNRDTGTTNPPAAHTHGSNPAAPDPATSLASDTPSSDSINHEPAFYTVIFIRSDGTPVGFPASSLAIWADPAGTPSAWALCDGTAGRPDLRNRFLKGAAAAGDGGSTGGAATHTHTLASHTHSTPFAHTHPDVTSSQRTEALVSGDVSGATASVATATHTHTLTMASQTAAITGQTDTAQASSNEPPHWVLAYVQNISGALHFPDRVIAFWTGTLASIPAGWVLCDGTQGTPDLRSLFVKGANTLGGIGTGAGALTHTHTATGHTHAVAAHVHTVTAGAGAAENRTAGAVATPTAAHTHTWPDTGSSAFTSGSTVPTVANYTDTQPPYTDVVFLQWQEPIPGRYNFGLTQTAVVAGATHALGTANLLVQAYTSTGVQLTPDDISVHPSSFDVTVTFAQNQTGYLVVSGRASPVVSQAFTGQTTVTVAGGTHTFATTALLVQVYDTTAPAPRRIRPDSVTVNQSTFDVVVTFEQNQSGTVLVGSATTPGPPYPVRSTLSGPSPNTITGASHGVGTNKMLVQVYDAATPAVQVEPDTLTIHPTTFDVTLTFRQTQSGAVVLGGSAGGWTVAAAQVTESDTAFGVAWSPKARLAAQVLQNETAQAITVAPLARLVSQVTENDTSQAMAWNPKARLISQVTSTQDSQAIGGAQQTRLLTQVAAPETAQSLAVAPQARLVGQVTSPEDSQGLTWSPKARLVGQVTSAEASQALLGGQVRLVNQVTSPHDSQSIAVAPLTRLVTQVVQPETAQSMSSGIRVAVAQVTSPHDSQPIAVAPLARLVGQVAQTATAQALTIPMTRLVNQVSSTQDSQAVRWSPLIRVLGQPAESATAHSASTTTGARANTAIAFGPTQSVTISQAQHGFATPNLIVQVYDNATPAAWVVPDTITVHPSTYDVTVTFRQQQSGTVVIGGALIPSNVAPVYSQAFAATQLVTVAGAAHGLGTAALLVQAYNTATPRRQLTPASITVHPSTFAVTVTFGQNESGTVVVSGKVQASAGLNFGWSFVNAVQVTVPGAFHGRLSTNLLVQVYDAAVPAPAWVQPDSLTIDPASYNVVASFHQAQSGTVVVHGATPVSSLGIGQVTENDTAQPGMTHSREMAVPQVTSLETAQPISPVTTTQPNFVQSFPATQSVTVLGSAHGFGTNNLLVQVYDTATPRLRLLPDSITIHPSTFDVTVTFAQPQAGFVVIAGARLAPGPSAHVAQGFVAQTLVTIPATAHGFGHPNLLIQVVDGGPLMTVLEPTQVTVNDNTYAVTVTFAQPQTGFVLIAGAVNRSLAPLPGFAFTTTATWPVSGATHGFGTWHTLAQTYAAAPPTLVTMNSTSFDVTATFALNQSGRMVLSGVQGKTLAPSAGVEETATAQGLVPVKASTLTQTAQSETAQPITAVKGAQFLYAHAFTNATQVIVAASAHGQTHPNLLVQAYNNATPRRLLTPAQVTIDPTSFQVVVDFLDLQSGTILVNGATGFALQANAVKTFTATQTVTVSQAEHRFASRDLQVYVYDGASPAVMIEPEQVTIDPTTFLVTVTFLDNQSGKVVIIGTNDPSIRQNYGYPFGNATQVNIFNSDHGFNTATLGVQVYDTSSPRRLLTPASVSVDPGNFTVIVTFLDAQSGTVVINGSSQGLVQPVVQVTDLGTAQTITPMRPIQVGQVAQTSTASTAFGLVLTRLAGQVTASETAQTVAWSPLARLVDQVHSPQTAQEITVTPALLVPQVLSPETAYDITWLPVRMLGQLASPETSQAIGGAQQTRLVTQTTEDGTAQPIAVAPKARLVTMVQESLTSQAIQWAPKQRLVNQVSDGETSQPMVAPHIRLVIQVTDSATAQAITVPLNRLVNQVATSATAQVIAARPLTRLVAQTNTLETSQTMLWRPLARLAAQVVSSETAQDVTPPAARLVSSVLDSHTAQAIAWAPKVRFVSQVSTTAEAQAISVPGSRLVLQVQESATAQAVQWSPRVRLVATTLSFQTAQDIAWAPLTRLVLPVVTPETAQGILVPPIRLVGQVTQASTAQGITLSALTRLLIPPLTFDTSQALTVPSIRLIFGTAATDRAQGITAPLAPHSVLVDTVEEFADVFDAEWAPKARLVFSSLDLETAQALTVPPIRLVLGAEASDLAQPISIPLSAKTVIVSQVASPQDAFAVTWAPKARLIFPLLVVETAEDLSAPHIRLLVQVTSSATSQPLFWRPMARLVNQVASTATAQAVTWSPLARLVAQVQEALTSQAVIWAPQARLITRAELAETSTPIMHPQTIVLLQPVEQALAQGVAWRPLARFVTQLLQTDQSLAMATLQGHDVQQVQSVELAQATTWSPKIRMLARVDAVTSALLVTPARAVGMLRAEETAMTQTLTLQLRRLVDRATTEELAKSADGSRTFLVQTSTETGTLGIIGPLLLHQVGLVTTNENVFAVLWAPKERLLVLVGETDLAQVLVGQAGIFYAGIFGTWSITPMIGGSWTLEPMIGGEWTMEHSGVLTEV
jgi:hypothetical protein